MDMKIGNHVMGTPSLGVIDHSDKPQVEKKVDNDGDAQPNAHSDKGTTADSDRTTV